MNYFAYKIQVSQNLCQELQLKNTLFNKEQEAIDSVSEALKQNNINFTMKQSKVNKVFIDNKKGELATIKPVKKIYLRNI